MSDALKPEPFIISQLVRAGMIQQLMQPVWEGMAERRWNDSQLSDLQILVRGIPMLEVYGQCTRGERTTREQPLVVTTKRKLQVIGSGLIER